MQGNVALIFKTFLTKGKDKKLALESIQLMTKHVGTEWNWWLDVMQHLYHKEVNQAKLLAVLKEARTQGILK